MRILHLSDTTLSGSPIRIVDLLNKHTQHEARHLVWMPTFGYRTFKTDLVGQRMDVDEIENWLNWADVVHYHNRWRRLNIFKGTHLKPPDKPSVIQIHSPRFSEDFRDEVRSGIQLAIIAQYHVRQWPEASFIVPNVVDVTDPIYQREPPENKTPVVSYAPSNINARGWDNKGYGIVMPYLKPLKFSRRIDLQLIANKPHAVAMEMKRKADIGIDEVATGSYHLSSLEYLAMGCACFCHLDELTRDAVKRVTGTSILPWIAADKNTFRSRFEHLLAARDWAKLGRDSRWWMEKYWNPQVLTEQYLQMYASLKTHPNKQK